MRLPLELTDSVIDHLHNDERTLSVCALTCRAWLPTVRFHRFHHVSLSCDATRRFHEVLLASPEVRALVHTLELHGQLGWPLDSPAWHGASYDFLKLLPAVTEAKLVGVYFEDSVQEMFVANLMGLTRLTTYRCRFRSFYFFVTLIGSFPSLNTLSFSLSLIWRFHFPSPSDIPSYLPEGLRTLKLGEPEDPRTSGDEQMTMREMLMLEIHAKRTMEVAQQLVDALGPGTLEGLEFAVGDANGLPRIFEHQTLNLALCHRLQTFAIKMLFCKGGPIDNDDIRGFSEMLSTLSSPVLATLMLSLHVHRAKDDPTIRRVTFSEMCAFDWAGIEAALARGSLPGLRSLIVEGGGETAVLEDHIARVLPRLHARRVIQLVPHSEN
ncbi:hypothetical protein FOMPIDRAFT_95356 [Fomitopsis schrenkii]|uniref:F-box domain-containing protein n=1 Tax=Fomitopsis schrenkii TaxID=2126942 RepID=S8F6G7_FOMSC|nr:hypothetical protein FOMPIDRAFT_95356 [Fomitopsis schrenkii]